MCTNSSTAADNCPHKCSRCVVVVFSFLGTSGTNIPRKSTSSVGLGDSYNVQIGVVGVSVYKNNLCHVRRLFICIIKDT